MKTSIENIATFLAAAIMADGKYDEAEKIALGEIAEAFELKEEELINAVDAEIANQEKLADKKLKEHLCVASTFVEGEENMYIFEAALELILVDGVLTADEVNVMFDVADVLAISQSDAVLMLADMAKEEPELEVKINC
ncbi:MAG: TerB family tellurite resistance protein [Bacteroidales bacterium]|nr:TerB family tellurite resistance protein [Bacteroidales bacterium]